VDCPNFRLKMGLSPSEVKINLTDHSIENGSALIRKLI
jgi:hypothetical protein